MKKKFNLYCGLLIAAIVLGIGIEASKMCYLMYLGGMAGWEQARQDRHAGNRSNPLFGIELQRHMVPVQMMPKVTSLLTPTDSIVNMKNGEKMPISTIQGIVFPKERSNMMNILQGIGSFSWVFIIIFWVAFIKLIIAVNKGHIFEKSMETQLAWGGWSVFGIYVLNWMGILIPHIQNRQAFEFANYDLVIIESPDMALLYAAFGMLLMGQIFKIGRQMKEEQELTI